LSAIGDRIGEEDRHKRHGYRASCFNNRSYVVVDPTGGAVSGRAEQDILISGKCGSQSHISLKKIIKRTMLPAANRASIG